MCVLALAWRAHPRWTLVAAGNRDELHARPAEPLHRWQDADGVIAGRDLESGGTWIGVSEAGRFAVVTNLRGHGAPAPGRVSRGTLVTDLLSGAGQYGDPATAALDDFNPFNVIVASAERARFLSNRPRTIRSALSPGVYGVSNGALDEPWPKTLRLKSGLLDWIVGDAREPEHLLEVLAERTLPDVGLPTTVPSDAPLEPAVSPIFIRHPVYGTRCSTVVAVDAQGRGGIIERRYDAAGEMAGETTLAFTWPREAGVLPG